MGIYPANLNLYLYNGDVNTSKLVGLNTMGQSIYDLYSPESPDPALGVMPGQGGPKATLINSAKCVSGGGTVSYKMVLSGGDPADRLYLNHPFDFLVSSQPSPGQYDFVLSPRMSNPAQANHLRVVVVWTAKGAGFDLTDAFGFVKNIPDAQRSTIEQFLTITTGADYYTQVNNPADGIWYHGASNIAGGSFTQSYTIDTSRITHDYAFYVRSDSPISNRDNYIRAEVYFPDTTGVRGTYYTHPAVYYLKDALSSENPAATYWHVFNIMKDGLDMRSRYVLINQKRTSPQYFSFQLPQP